MYVGQENTKGHNRILFCCWFICLFLWVFWYAVCLFVLTGEREPVPLLMKRFCSKLLQALQQRLWAEHGEGGQSSRVWKDSATAWARKTLSRSSKPGVTCTAIPTFCGALCFPEKEMMDGLKI